MGKKKKMTLDDREMLYDVCYRSKLGQPLLREEMVWLAHMFKYYPDEYKEVHAEAEAEAVKTVNPLA